MKHVERYNESFWDKFKKKDKSLAGLENDDAPQYPLTVDPDFITKINGVEFHEVKDYPSIPHEVWLTISPYVKRDCYHCAFLVSAISLWCGNDEAIEYRGTVFPGVFKCIFWQPNEKVISQSKKELKKLDEEV